AVLAVAGADSLGLLCGCLAAVLSQGFLRPLQAGVEARFAGPARDVEGGPAEHAGGDVAEALDRVAPTAVGVLVCGQPGKAALNQGVVFRGIGFQPVRVRRDRLETYPTETGARTSHEGQGADGGGGG